MKFIAVVALAAGAAADGRSLLFGFYTANEINSGSSTSCTSDVTYGTSMCPCVAKTSSAAGTSYADVPDIGDWCSAWDGKFDYCAASGTSFGADWCDDSWCYVDPNNCDVDTYPSSYFPGEDLYFAYSTCDTEFCGNDWVGQGVECADVDGCACIGTDLSTNGTFMADVPNIGDWCTAWDGQFNYCNADGSSFGADWCANSWCYVDPNSCDVPTHASTYFTGETLYFSYKACEPDLCGNAWVGQGTLCPGEDDCACIGTDLSTTGTFMADVPNMGDWCSAWDGEFDYCSGGGSSFGADWCADPWCYVDETTCTRDTYPSTYFPGSTLYFAYSTCDTSFCGNDWVGQGVECTSRRLGSKTLAQK